MRKKKWDGKEKQNKHQRWQNKGDKSWHTCDFFKELTLKHPFIKKKDNHTSLHHEKMDPWNKKPWRRIIHEGEGVPIGR